MQMIDVLKRLAELDAQNPNIVKESQQAVDECGMMGGMSQPHSPASINMTAATGEELSAMLKDIMTLAGRPVEPEMPMGGEEPMGGADGIAVVDTGDDVEVEPSPEVGADDTSVMRSMIDKLNPSADDAETDSGDDAEPGDDADKEKVDEFDNEPADPTKPPPFDANQFANKNNQPGPDRMDGTMPRGNPQEATYESLMAEYRKFLGEGMSDHEDELSLRTSVLDVLQTIYDGASAGEEMIDTVADELGDYYDEVEQSGDSELMKAYRFVREKGADAEGNPEMMAKVVQQAMSVLGKDQGVAEGSVFDIDTTGYTDNDMAFVNHDINQIKKIRAKLLKIPGFSRNVNDEASQLKLAEKIFNAMKRGLSFDSALVIAQKQGVAEGLDDNQIWNQYGQYTKQDLMKEFPNLTPKDAQIIVNFSEYGWSNHPEKEKFRNEVVKKIKLAMGQQGVAEDLTDNDIARTAYMYGLKHGREGVGNNMDRAKAEWGDNFKHYNTGFLKGRNEKSKNLKAVGQGYGKKQRGVAEEDTMESMLKLAGLKK